nr:hypothetical protein GCM10020185_31760 [Pseudomonas brassicacearum subsp. brassicacearum]
MSAQHSQKKPTPFSIPARQAANAQNPCGEGIYPRWAAQQPQTANAVCLIDRKLTEIFFLIEATDFFTKSMEWIMTSENRELSPDLHSQIKKFSSDGDLLAESGRFEEAVAQYNKAWALIPSPKK